jgi:GNAT superfamily N-acetyltransferase
MHAVLDGYDVVERVPGVVDYNRVRADAGLSVKPAEAAERALANTIHGVRVELDGDVVGLGRAIGDGGLYYEIMDVAVLPEHQGNGLGAAIMDSLMSYLRENATPGVFVGLHAGRGVSGLYERYGFELRPPEAPGMSQVL